MTTQQTGPHAVAAHERTGATLADRLAALDWAALERTLDAAGYAVIPRLVAPHDCRTLAASYEDDALFRSRVVMARHGYGSGEYRYFAYPLPPLVRELREALYAPLAQIANRWNERWGVPTRFPARHSEYLEQCRRAGQTRPTPLLLAYRAGDYNRLHQDLYGEHVFPLQATVLLSAPNTDFTGGEFVLTEQRPRRQSRVEVVPLTLGDAVLFAVAQRPIDGARGTSRATMRHGVSLVRTGARRTLGIIFHDAR